MRRISFLASVLLLTCSWAMAKTDGNNNPSINKTKLIRGCLSGSAGNYVLTDEPGYDYQLQGNMADLDKMIGSEIQVRGVETREPAEDNSTNGTINVKKAMKLLDACSFQGDQK